MTRLPKSASPEQIAALARLAATHDGRIVLSYLEACAAGYLEGSLRTDSESATRQAQGGYMALTSFTTLARSAGELPRE